MTKESKMEMELQRMTASYCPNMDMIDLQIALFFFSEAYSGSLDYVDVNGERYFYIDYNDVIEVFPLLRVKTKAVYRRFQRMVKDGFLSVTPVKDYGNYVFYGEGETLKKMQPEYEKIRAKYGGGDE